MAALDSNQEFSIGFGNSASGLSQSSAYKTAEVQIDIAALILQRNKPALSYQPN